MSEISEHCNIQESTEPGVYFLGSGSNGVVVIAPPEKKKNIPRIRTALTLITALNQILMNKSDVVEELFEALIKSGDKSVAHIQVCSTSCFTCT